MRFKSIFSSAALISCWAFGVAKLYQNQEIIIDSATLGSQIFEDDELMQLLNAKVTLNNFTDIRLPQGISLNSRSVLKINAPPGHGKPYSLVINGQVTIGKDSKFIFDGSSLEYESQSAASSNFKFDINTGSKGVFIFTYCTMTIKLPKLSEGLIDSDSVAAIHIGGTFEAPNINSPLSILGTLEVLTSETTVDGSFDDKLWRVDLGPDQIVEDGEGYRYILTGNIHCQAYVSVYADIFKATKTVLHALGYRGYTVVSPMTIDLSEGPVFSGGLYLYYIVLPEGQDGLTFLNFAVHEDKGIPAPTLGFMFLYSGDQTDVVATANQNIINVMNLNSKKSISVIGDHNYNITTKYSDGKSIQQQGYSGVQSYPNELIVYLYAPPSEEPDYTTTIDKGNGEFETDLVSHITTKDSDGKPTTIVTTIPWKPSEEADYTTTIDSDGHTVVVIVSHITTIDSNGNVAISGVTVLSYDRVDDGAVYTSAPAYLQPSVSTIIVSQDNTTASVVVSYFPSEGEDGVTRTRTTIISTITASGEADYTTTVDRGNGSIETDVISHITTTDSNGNPTTITTTITNTPTASNSKANVGSDYTTTVVSDGHTSTEVVSHSTGTDEHGHTIVSTVTQTVGVQSHGSTVSSTAPVSTVSGAGSSAPGTAGVGGIVNSQKPQSGNVAGQGSGNEKPTQAAGTAGGSGSGSGSGSGPVHQSAGSNVPSGSPSVQSAKGTASPVSGIHSSQTPHSVPLQAQQQGQGQGQTPSSRQQAATTVLLPSGSSVNNNGSGFSSTQTASVLQGKGASIRVASSSIIFSIIAVIVVGMI